MKGTHPDIRDFIKRLEGQGWSAGRTRGDHLRLVHPLLGIVVMASTPRAPWRAIANTEALIKRLARAKEPT